jgi:hypothetical protein
MAALALEGEDSRSSTWLNRAVSRLTRVKDLLEGIQDGSWHEGINYQSYGLTMMLPFLHNLKRLKGTDLIPHQYLRNYSFWRIYNSLPNTWRQALNFGDFDWFWGNSYASENILRFVAGRYKDPHAEWMARHLIQNTGRDSSVYRSPWYVFEFFYYDVALSPKAPDSLALSRYFPDSGSVIWRSGWGDQDLVFGLMSGRYGGMFTNERFVNQQYPFELNDSQVQLNKGHDHDDSGSFYLHKGNVSLSSEKEGNGKFETSFHNTILIDGKGQYRPPRTFNDSRYWDKNRDLFKDINARMETVHEGQDFNYLIADLSQRYREYNSVSGAPDALKVNSLKRHVLFVKPMVDDIRGNKSQQYDWVAHFEKGVQVEGDWIKGESENNQVLGIKVLRPNNFQTKIANDGKPLIQVHPDSKQTDTQFSMVLFPTQNSQWQNKPSIISLGSNNEGSGVRVTSIGEYLIEGQVASLVKDPSGELSRLYLGQGKSLLDRQGKRELINLPNQTTIEARFVGDSLSLLGNNIESLKIHAPNTDSQKVTLNGNKITVTKNNGTILLGKILAPNTPSNLRTKN